MSGRIRRHTLAALAWAARTANLYASECDPQSQSTLCRDIPLLQALRDDFEADLPAQTAEPPTPRHGHTKQSRTTSASDHPASRARQSPSLQSLPSNRTQE